MEIRVAAAQIRPRLGDIEYNRRRMTDFVRKAAELEVDLLVFPELANSGYNFPSREFALKCAESLDGETVRIMSALAREYSMYIVFGLCEREGERLFNSAVLVGPEGLIGVYRKVHLFMREKEIFERGREFRVFTTPIARIGLMICFDWLFPEAARTLALRGAEVIAHPANLVLPYCPRAMPIRALENRVYTVTANRVGYERGLRFIGLSLICAPTGDVLAQASSSHEELIYADIDPAVARDKRITEMNDIFKDRVPEAYALR